MKTKVNYISFINVIAALMVVMMHANSSFWSYSTNHYWAITNVIESVGFCAVPLFFMLSGATLIDYQKSYTTKEFFKKRFVKSVIPFLFWSVFAMFWASRKVLIAMAKGQPNEGLKWTVQSVIDGILNNKFQHIYWFFIPLFCIYIVIPFFAAISEKRRVKVYTYAIVVGLIFNYTIPFILSLLNEYVGFSLYFPMTIFITNQYLIYPLIGYVLHKQELTRKWRIIIYSLAIAGFIAFILGTYIRTRSTGKLDGLYRGYYNLPCALYSTGMFLLLKDISARIKSVKVNRFFAWMQSYTFPIYLIHRYLLDIFEENLHYIHLQKASLIYVFGATILAVTLSVLITMLFRKIPVLRRVVP